jgi:inosine-uridine nucleoside N-ribohydrolase
MQSQMKIIIDTDISLGTPYAEIDDGAALLVLLNSPMVEILAITTVHGNVPVDLATTNALRLLALAGHYNVPMYEGSAGALVKDDRWLAFLNDWQSQYGETPRWEGNPQPQPAADAIISAVEEYPGQVSILALGPLTNLALALRRAPQIARMVKSVVAMGGSLSKSPQAEFNIRCDPEAAAVVLDAEWPLQLHGLEITRQVFFSFQDFEALENDDPARTLLRHQAAQWIPIVESQGWEIGGCALHDAIAVAAFLQPGLCTYEVGYSIQVKLDSGPERGVTRAVSRENTKNVSVANGIDVQSCKDFIQSRL